MTKLLQRVTSSGKYIPFIDGLRFFSILSVICFHFYDYYKDRVYTTLTPEQIKDYMQYTSTGFAGVMLFFGISGFVLATPFINQYVYDGRKVKIKDYLMRRLTRLEPPYIIVLTLLFILSLIVGTKGGFTELLPHYIASFFYSHNWYFETYPVLSDVFWSLEIEVQFYLLAPLLALIFKLNKHFRRIVLLLIVLFYTDHIRGLIDPWHFRTIIKYIEYFLAGMLAADLYYEYRDKIKPTLAADAICFYLIFSIWTGWADGLPLALKILGLISLSNFSIYWKKLISLKWITIIGGMCYTIYMVHQRLLYMVTGFMKNELYFDQVWKDVLLRASIFTLALAIVSALFFIFVERPTMKRDWWKIRSFKKLFFE